MQKETKSEGPLPTLLTDLTICKVTHYQQQPPFARAAPPAPTVRQWLYPYAAAAGEVPEYYVPDVTRSQAFVTGTVIHRARTSGMPRRMDSATAE